MFKKAKLVLMTALTAAGIASPAVAQSSLEHFGSQLPYYYDGSGAQLHGNWAPEASPKIGQRPSQSPRPLYLSVPRGRR
jgi:hypothetical protein